GHRSIIKASSKDEVLIKHLVEKLTDWNKEINELVVFQEMLKGCDAYIATGSNNSARYFEYYFKKYPHIIRRNRTTVAVLDGNETTTELEKLADDVHLYFGMGCRNVTKIYVPKEYDFIPMLSAFKKYDHFKDHNKYKNNYDYNLALHILNGKFYMSNESIILLEKSSIFSPISQLNYEFYTDKNVVAKSLGSMDDLQCAVGHGYLPFGQAQIPSLTDYADGIDTLNFLTKL
ncbi:MAG TPA: acyl-CoA reductase, partial [Chitinophagaceae bacterium]